MSLKQTVKTAIKPELLATESFGIESREVSPLRHPSLLSRAVLNFQTNVLERRPAHSG